MNYLIDIEQRHFDFAKLHEILKSSVVDQTDEKFNDTINLLRQMGETEIIEAFIAQRSIKQKTKQIDEKERKIHSAKEQVEIKKLQLKYIDEMINVFTFNKTEKHLSRCVTEKKALEAELERLQIFHKNLVNESGLLM